MARAPRRDEGRRQPDAARLLRPDDDRQHGRHGDRQASTSALRGRHGARGQLRRARARRAGSLFKGEIATLDADFGEGGVVLGVRGYDRIRRLTGRARSDVFKNLTSSDAVKKVAGRGRLRSARDDSGATRTSSCSRTTRPTGTFLWRLARKIDFGSRGRQEGPLPASGHAAGHDRLRWGAHVAHVVPPARHGRAAGRGGRGARPGTPRRSGRSPQRACAGAARRDRP